MVPTLSAIHRHGTCDICSPLLPGTILRHSMLWILHRLDDEIIAQGCAMGHLCSPVRCCVWHVLDVPSVLLRYGGLEPAMEAPQVAANMENGRLDV